MTSTAVERTLHAELLRKVYQTKTGPVVAVDGVTLWADGGEILALLGPNGAGKTTTLRMLVTLLKPSGGSARIAGFDVARQPAEVRRRIGYVSQRGASFGVETGRDELIMQTRIFGASAAQARGRAATLIEQFQLESVADRQTRTWSGGQRRRLDLALGMVHQPALLFLDEPTTGLDPQSRANLWDHVRRLRDAGTTIILTTHYLDEADVLADRVTVIDQGCVVAEGTPDALKQQIAHDVVEVTIRSAADAACQLLQQRGIAQSVLVEGQTICLHVKDAARDAVAVVELLQSTGFAPSALSISRPTLDDVFLALTGRSLREGTGTVGQKAGQV